MTAPAARKRRKAREMQTEWLVMVIGYKGHSTIHCGGCSYWDDPAAKRTLVAVVPRKTEILPPRPSKRKK